MSDFELIRAEAGTTSVQRLCRLLGVSPSGYYAWREREPSKRESDELRLVTKIRAVHQETGKAYGSRRMTTELREDGESVGRRRIQKLMRRFGLQGKAPRRFRVTTDSNHSEPIAPNLLKQDFAADAPNRVWVGDITYVWTAEGWSYLAVLLDLHSRRVVGWAFGDNMRTELPLNALERALASRQPSAGLIHHSDRGSQYASREYRAVLRRHQAAQSMSRAGDCYDNAVAESFFASLKKERLHRRHFATRTEAYDTIADFIDGFYNPRRRHSTLGNMSPMNFENQSLAQAA